MTVARVKKLLDKVLEFVVIFFVAVLVLDVIWQVFTRKVLNNPSKWTEEFAIILLIWVSLLGAAVAVDRGMHLSIDYFVGKIKPKFKKNLQILVYLLIMFFSVYVMLYGGIMLVKKTLEMGQVTPVWGLKVGYIYTAVPVSGFFMILYSSLDIYLSLIGQKK